MNDELKAKYSRIANDPSQLEMFKNDVIDGKVVPAVPEPSVEEAGKVIKVNESGAYELGEAGGGGTQLYRHTFVYSTITYSLICTKSSKLNVFDLTHNKYSLENIRVMTDGVFLMEIGPASGGGADAAFYGFTFNRSSEPNSINLTYGAVSSIYGWSSITDYTVTPL